MRVTSMEGNLEVAMQQAFENKACFVELHESTITKDWFSVLTRPRTIYPAVNIVVSMDNWHLANSEVNIEILYEDIAEHLYNNQDVDGEVILVNPNFMEGIIGEDKVRRLLDKLVDDGVWRSKYISA